MSRTPTPPIERFDTATGLRLYRLRLEAFPRFYVHAYLVLGADTPILIDVGSGWANSNTDLLTAFDSLHSDYGESVRLADVGQIIITHAHIDHFGGLTFVREHTPAPVAVHVLDRRVLINYTERVLVAAKGLRVFLRRAGIADAHITQLMDLYSFGKGFYRPTAVDHVLADGDRYLDLFTVTHVPGHCPGQVMLQHDDILITADHILEGITPHQVPESITRNTGLGHYLDSLDKASRLPNVRLALGGHKRPLTHYYDRIGEIRQSHMERLEAILAICTDGPKTIKDISMALFQEQVGYNALLALEETGAHVEYLYQRGELEAANLDQIAAEDDPPILYQRT